MTTRSCGFTLLAAALIVPLSADDDSAVIGPYRVRATQTANGKGRLDIRQGAKVVLTRTGGKFSLGACEPHFPSGKSITGDRVPSLIVQEWTGGAHCCFSWSFYRMGTQLEELGKFDAGHGDLCPLEDLNKDGVPEVKALDWTFAYWNASFAESPAFAIVYKLRDSKYVFAPDLMRKPAPDRTAMRNLLAQLNGWSAPTGPIPPALWSNMLDLIASGNASAITGFLDQAWPKNRPGRDKFVADFMRQLHKSPNWARLTELNGGSIALR